MKSSTFFLSHVRKHPELSREKINSSSPLISKPPFSNDSPVIWSNLAFISDENDCSSANSNTILSSPVKNNNEREFFATHVTDEELRLREELATEIEKELEREIMEGILGLVRRLSNLKAEQIARGLKNFHLDEFLGESFTCGCCNSSNIVDDHVNPPYLNRKSQGDDARCRRVSGNWMRKHENECSDMESTTDKWCERRKDNSRRRRLER